MLSIFKNEETNIAEWIEHYIWQGADHFFLIDNNSRDAYFSHIQPYLNAGCVTLFKRSERYAQELHYNSIYNIYRNTSEWIAIVDLDEFWFGTSAPLVHFLHSHDTATSVYSHWKMFGSSGKIHHSPGTLRKEFTMAEKNLNPHTKGIVRTKYVNNLKVHQHEPFDSKSIFEDIELRLNHYPIQSKRYFESNKMQRGDVASQNADRIRDWRYFESYDELCNITDTLLVTLMENGYV